MNKLFEWIKNNKLAAVIIFLLGFFLLKNYFSQGGFPLLLQMRLNKSQVAPSGTLSTGVARGGVAEMATLPVDEAYAPQPDAEERMVVEQSSLSLVVNDVRGRVEEMITYVENEGGYMVSSSISRPEETPYANLTVRVPSGKLRSTLEHFRGLAVKVTMENLLGQDVTDQYTDLQARLNTLNKTKAKFEEILNQATKVNDILQVQRELISLQSQIDSLKGRQEYLEKTAENAKLTVYLSTDELSLPYSPEGKAFRPKVIFKQAVRSLVLTFRSLGKLIIWVAVYAPIWGVILLAAYLLRRRKRE